MGAEATFVVLYATALLAGAVGLDRLGRARGIAQAWGPRDPRLVAPVDSTAADDPGAAWPHCEVPRLYTGIGLVAAAASTMLLMGELLGREHRPAEAAALLSCAVLAVLTVGWLGRKLACPRPMPAAPDL
jgi:hypothetical protein